MIFHTLFVLFTLSGWQIKWTTQNRADTGLTIKHCLALYGWLCCLGLILFPVSTYYLGKVSWWLLPIFAGWVLAPFLAWVTSGRRTGIISKACGLFVTPEEIQPPPELQGLDHDGGELSGTSPLWVQALLSPYVQAVHLSLVRQGTSGNGVPIQFLATLRERLIREGPQALNTKEKSRLLWDGETVFWLHQELWSRPASELHPSWLKFLADCGKSPLLSHYLMTQN
jgi:membrane glycosyltransferase